MLYCNVSPDNIPCMDEAGKRVRGEAHRRRNREYARRGDVQADRSAYSRWRKYGLTPESLAAKMAAQGGRCPLCPPGAPVPGLWDVDHDHDCCPPHYSCGRCLRDILCRKHNRGLGAFDDDPEMLRAAADYIERHRARIAESTEPRRVKAAKRGEGHQAWKGADITRAGIHSRVWRAKGKPLGCVSRETARCTSERYEWVPVHDADPTDPDGYVSMCKPCRLVYEARTGSGHANAKLTDEQAAEIRERYAASDITQTVLAAEYGISPAAVSNIIRGESYKPADGDAAGVVERHREKRAQDTSGSVSFGALRRRVYRANGPAARCSNRETAGCTNEHYEWALTPGANPAVMDNWVQLCAPCRTAVHGTSGAGNARAKLTQEDADAMRALYAGGGITQPQLAERFGVSQSTASNILLNRRYATT